GHRGGFGLGRALERIDEAGVEFPVPLVFVLLEKVPHFLLGTGPGIVVGLRFHFARQVRENLLALLGKRKGLLLREIVALVVPGREEVEQAQHGGDDDQEGHVSAPFPHGSATQAIQDGREIQQQSQEDQDAADAEQHAEKNPLGRSQEVANQARDENQQ